MDQSNIVPPHLNSEVYKTFEDNTSSYPYFDYVNIRSDGATLIGCSDLTGRYWKGAVLIANDIEHIKKDTANLKHSIHLSSTTAAGCFMHSPHMVLICEDSGEISIWKYRQTPWVQWDQEITVTEHDDAVLALDCLDPDTFYITVGVDKNIKIWDVNDMICVKNYDNGHQMMISDVAVKPNSKNNFVTCSLDCTLTLWTDKSDTPSISKLGGSDCGIRCVKWLNENDILFGDESGKLNFIDCRQPGKCVTLTELPAPIHRIEVQPQTRHIGVCCDNKTLTIYKHDGNGLTSLYQNNKIHNDYIRGLAWDPKDNTVLHTVGWDSGVGSHKY